MPTMQLECTVCSGAFDFTEDEQSFYEQKGFQPPKKCKPCRDQAKRNRGGGGGGGGGFGRAPRQMYDTVCSACGVETQVPFMPNGSKPIFCRDCFQDRRSY